MNIDNRSGHGFIHNVDTIENSKIEYVFYG